jgi:heme/copper-type cytochrome/quinol oxidase subunit 3
MRELRPRAALDVETLPDVCFGPRDIMWWGTLGFVVIEGWAVVLTVACWIYLHQSFSDWPPPGTARPSLGWPTVELVLMLASVPLVIWCDRAARRFELRRVRAGFALASAVGVALAIFYFVLLVHSLNVRWDTNAYGSAQWLVLTYFGTLVLVEACEVVGLTLAYWFAPVEDRHFPDGADAVFYWKFMVIVWVPLYVLCFLLPRWT